MLNTQSRANTVYNRMTWRATTFTLQVIIWEFSSGQFFDFSVKEILITEMSASAFMCLCYTQCYNVQLHHTASVCTLLLMLENSNTHLALSHYNDRYLDFL